MPAFSPALSPTSCTSASFGSASHFAWDVLLFVFEFLLSSEVHFLFQEDLRILFSTGGECVRLAHQLVAASEKLVYQKCWYIENLVPSL